MLRHAAEFAYCASVKLKEENLQYLLLLDWASGHAAKREDALAATEVSWRYDGSQRVMHDAVIRDLRPEANDHNLRHA